MAGAGYKLFNTGDVLTAAQVNTYLQEQAVMRFTNAAARTTALSGVLAEGMVSYLMDTDAVEVYNGTSWVGVATGDITGVTAGTGLSGGGTSGDVTLSLSTPVSATNGGTAQTTYATGDILYASASNTLAKRTIGTTGQVLTVSGGLPTWSTPSATAFAGNRNYSTANQSIAHNADVTITWSAEDFDTDAYHSTSTNTGRITIPSGKAGKYAVNAQVTFAGNSAGIRYLYIAKNGSSVYWTYSNNNNGNECSLTMNTVMDLAVNDYLEVKVYQSSGGAINALTTSLYSWFGVTYLGA